MIKDEDYIVFLKSIITCISHGDYYAVKELSNLELERMNKKLKQENSKFYKLPFWEKINKIEKNKFLRNINN